MEQKKADITEFINTFVPALNEYRDNYNGNGSEGGKKRAQMAHDILNKFYDGDPNGEYAVNDTGKPLGDLLLNKTKTEIGDNAYNALSQEEKMNTADFQQIILESSGPAVLIIEQALALATDTAEDSWLDRLDGLTGEELVERIAEFAPEAEGQDIPHSAAMNLLASHFEDYAMRLSKDWSDVRERILWFEQYCDEHDFWQDEDRLELDNQKTIEYFDSLKEEDESRYKKDSGRFLNVSSYYFKIKDVAYPGDWGETLYEFLRPEDENEDYSENPEYFAPMAAALSKGQRAALEFITLSTLLKVGMDNDSVTQADIPSSDEIFKDKNGNELSSISIYSGINRAIFRKGVALTSDALIRKNMGKDPYEELWGDKSLINIFSFVGLGIGLASFITGSFIYIKATTHEYLEELMLSVREEVPADRSGSAALLDEVSIDEVSINDEVIDSQQLVTRSPENAKLALAGKWLMGIGGALMVMATILKAVQMIKYYKRTFSKIPTMIVDEADIVSYSTDDKGNQVKNIEFDQFAYYEVVKCNRQEIGLHVNAQGGVDQYKEWGCGDAADLNADIGKQWLAMYVNRSSAKGNPILADSLTLQMKNAEMPSDCNGCLHIFTFENPVKIDDMNYSYRGDKGGIYLFWKGDENAFADTGATASAFNAGYMAISGVGGLALGVLGTALVTGRKKKEQEEPAA